MSRFQFLLRLWIAFWTCLAIGTLGYRVQSLEREIERKDRTMERLLQRLEDDGYLMTEEEAREYWNETK